MTVAELIAKLQTMDQSLPVWSGFTVGPRDPGPLNTDDIYQIEIDDQSVVMIDVEE